MGFTARQSAAGPIRKCSKRRVQYEERAARFKECTRVYRRMHCIHRYTSVYSSIKRYTRVYTLAFTSKHRYKQVYVSIHMYADVYTGIHKYTLA